MSFDRDTLLSWLPPDLPEDTKDALIACYPNPHEVAARAWEMWAASLSPQAASAGAVVSAATGNQSISYQGTLTNSQLAAQRAAYHWARVHGLAVASPDYPVPVPGSNNGVTGGRPTWPIYAGGRAWPSVRRL